MSVPEPLKLTKTYDEFSEEGVAIVEQMLTPFQKEQILREEGQQGLGPHDEENRILTMVSKMIKVHKERNIATFTVVGVITESLIIQTIIDWTMSGLSLADWFARE